MSPYRVNDPQTELREPTHYVLGGAHVGIAIAERLRAAGHRVAVIDDAYDSSASTDVPGIAADPAESDVLSDLGIQGTSTVVVATGSDRRNLLLGQSVRSRFGVSRIVPLVNDPSRVSAFEDAGYDPLCVTTVLAETVGETV